MAEERSYRVYYVIDGKREPGATFATLDEALEHAKAVRGHRACDVLMPNGRWYAKQQTVGLEADDTERSTQSERVADETVAWMRSRPSRSSRGKPDEGSDV